MSLTNIFNYAIFSSRYKLPLHVAQLILIIIAVGLSVPNLFIRTQTRSRANTIALGMGAKSLVIIAYQLLSEHVSRFHKFHSYKANAILNVLEILFWSAVAFLVMSANTKSCSGSSCTTSWIVVVIAVIVVNTEIVTSGICIREFRENRGKKSQVASGYEIRRPFGEEEMGRPQRLPEEPRQVFVQAGKPTGPR